MRIAGYLQGNLEHHLDHLAPFCSLMGLPFFVTEDELFEQARRFYPDLEVYLLNSLEAPFEVTKKFDIVITTLPRPFFDDIFSIAELSLGKRLKTAWLPHGNSDKDNLAPLVHEEILLVYTPHFFAATPSQTVIPIGNFRAQYFQKHRAFYNTLLDSMNLGKPFILYAPTWDSSLQTAADLLSQALLNFPFLIKPHPNQAQNPEILQKILSSNQWLDRFPPIYPLLERTSHFIGDFSSIGYDFLYFNRPMFFLSSKTTPPLHHCGKTLTTHDLQSLPSFLNDPQSALTSTRETLYLSTFGKQELWDRSRILNALEHTYAS